jgi:hypothetical protein
MMLIFLDIAGNLTIASKCTEIVLPLTESGKVVQVVDKVMVQDQGVWHKKSHQDGWL